MKPAHRRRDRERCRSTRLLTDERGATAAEYALLASLVAVLAMAGLEALANGTEGLYGRIGAIGAAMGGLLGG